MNIKNHIDRLRRSFTKKDSKKKLELEKDNKKTKRMVMKENAEEMVKDENKNRRWKLTKSQVKKKAEIKAERTMAEISMDWTNRYWASNAEEEWSDEQVNTCEDWSVQIHWTSPPKAGMQQNKMGYDIVTMNSAKAVSERLLYPIVDYPENKLMREFPNDIKPRGRQEMKRDAIQIFSLHVRLLAIQQWMIDHCKERASLIKDGSWTITDIFDENLDELYGNRRELKMLRDEFLETYVMINKLTSKYTVRNGIISYEEVVSVIEHSYNEDEYDRVICWIRNLCNADPRFSNVEGSKKFKLKINDLETLTKFMLGENENADPTDKERLMQLASVVIIEGDRLPKIVTDEGRAERRSIELRKDRNFVKEWNKSAVHLDILSNFDTNRLQNVRQILGRDSVGESPRSSTQIEPIRISRYAQPPDYNSVIGRWNEMLPTATSPIRYPTLTEAMINGTENVNWGNRNDDSGFYDQNVSGAVGGQSGSPQGQQNFIRNKELGLTQGMQQMSLENNETKDRNTENMKNNMESTRLQQGNQIRTGQFTDGYHDESIRFLNTMERWIRSQSDQGFDHKEYSKCLVELGLNYTDSEIVKMWRSILRKEGDAVSRLDTERLSKLREIMIESKGSVAELKDNGPVRDKWMKYGAVEAEKLRHEKEDMEKVIEAVNKMDKSRRKSEEKCSKSEKKRKEEREGVKPKKRHSTKESKKDIETDDDDPYGGYYDRKEKVKKSKERKRMKDSRKGYNLRMRNTNYGDESTSESESDSSESESGSSDEDSEEEMDDPKQRERAERAYRNIADFERGESAEYFLKRVTACIKRMFPRCRYRTGPTDKKRYELIFDKLSNEVQDRVDGSRDVTEDNVKELEKFLKERMGKQEVDLARLQNLVQMTIRPGEWADWLDQMESAVTKTENFKGKINNKAEKKHFDSVCIDQVLRVMQNKQKSLLASMRIIRPKKSDINYYELREALLHSDSMDGIINAGEPSRREHENRRYNENKRDRRNMKVSYEDEECSEDDDEIDMNFEKTRREKKKQQKDNKQYVKNTDMVKISNRMQRQEESMNRRMNEVQRQRENDEYKRDNWENERRERERMEDPSKPNIISQPIIIGAPTTSWDNDKFVDMMNGKMSQRWNGETKPFYQNQRNDKNMYKNEYFRNNTQERDMGPRYEKRDQGGGRNYNGNQGKRYNQNPGGYNGQNNGRYNNFRDGNNGDGRNDEFTMVGRNFKDRNQGRRFESDRGPGDNFQRRNMYNEERRNNDREYVNGRYMRMNIGDNKKKNMRERRGNMRMRNTNNDTRQRCFNCGKPGHLQIDCRLQTNNRFRESGGNYRNDYQPMRTQQECYNCGKKGHISKDCRTNKNREPRCAACQRDGHIFQDCRTHEIVRVKHPKGNQVFVNEKLRCEGCRNNGHTIHDCIEYMAITKNLSEPEMHI